MRTLRSRPVILGVALALLALGLGYVGERSLSGVTMSRSDALFSSLQLFALEGSLPPHGTPWQLNIARFLAPLAVAYATVVAVMALFRDQVQRAWVATFARDHVVLVGLGRTSAHLAAALRRSGQRVVVVDADSANQQIAGTRAHGARVVIGDATQPVILGRAQARRATHVIVRTGDDARNLEIAEQVRQIASTQGSGRRTTIHVEIADQTLWAELGRLELALVRSGLVLEFYNEIDRAAQALLSEAERGEGDGIYRTVLIDGDGPLLERTLVHLVRRAVASGHRPKVHVTNATEGTLAPLVEREPWIAEAADLSLEAGRAAESDTALALVCLADSDARAIARALILARPPSRPAVYVSVQGQQTGALLDSTGVVRKVHLVPTRIEAMSGEILQQSGPELMARVRHEEYVAEERSHGSTIADNPSLVAWDELPESLKESNRRFAESVGEVIHALGGWLMPLRSLESNDTFLAVGDTLERLAENEHERWMAALVDDGWTLSSGPKDPVNKTHPLLVPWSELAEAEREKDRDAIRAIPRMLARVGFSIELPAPPVQVADHRSGG